MNLWQNLLIALDSLRVNKLRSLLTMIGIVVGVASVVLVVSIGQVTQGSVQSELAQYPPGLFDVRLSEKGYNDTNYKITVDDLKQVRTLNSVQAATGTLRTNMSSKSGDVTLTFNITGTFADFLAFEKVKFEAGRFFTASEQNSRQKVIVVGSNYAVRQFGSSEQAIQRKVTLDNMRYEIVGVYKVSDNNVSLGAENSNTYSAYMPYASLPPLKDGTNNQLDSLTVIPDTNDDEKIDKVAEAIRKSLGQAHNGDSSYYQIFKLKDEMKLFSSIFGMLQNLIGSVAGISLLVGGIGVMNIMLVSVTERTKEIGTRKALGATPALIMQQFMIEAIILCLIGGGIGISIGVSGSLIYALFSKFPFTISWGMVILAFGFSTTVGLFFGWYPARKAAKMQPIEALRYE